ncbi:LytTr DNA-binding domain protein [Leptospira inadai serovar Lyme str. 10]|uniref:LytTr DNA-binding domain protein n=2 Tax=Leptospira inadai serovar Lyme TaxID=293084 RepID=V6HJC5_9LEPT|nr:LytTR family DNA-binding domain-containing protein [Leptospira inadai]EQA36945.1 LytTr DNA-binding domain protein [Leptospira inadai serovar Lyme str. 10]PNV74626.1 DNA-binding response regulator [Leptospira inadai serovar Lyme]
MMGELYKVLVVEDEVPARDLLRNYLQHWKNCEVSGIARTGVQAVDLLSRGEFDLVFLDINLPEKTGLQVLEESGPSMPVLIFTTAYREHTLKAFEVGACDYLLKPYSKERFDVCMTRAIEQLRLRAISKQRPEGQLDPVLVFREKGLSHRVLSSDVFYLTANGKHSILHTKNGDFETPRLLGDFEKQLSKDDFLRIHRKYIVNKTFIAATKSQPGGSYSLFLKNEDETNLPVGREFVERIKQLFKK